MEERIIDRFDKYMSHKGLNDNQITVNCGLSVGLLGKARKQNGDIGKQSVEKILKKYQDLNKVWLMTGYGEMLNTPQEVQVECPCEIKSAQEKYNQSISVLNEPTYVPLLPISAQGGSLNDFIVSVKDSDCEKVISPIKGADFAMSVAGESMYPEYPAGSQILIKRINEKAFIEWGKVYVLDTCNGTVIKIITKAQTEGRLLCTSINPEQQRYAPFEISETDIYGIYRVLLCMSVK